LNSGRLLNVVENTNNPMAYKRNKQHAKIAWYSASPIVFRRCGLFQMIEMHQDFGEFGDYLLQVCLVTAGFEIV
jgi:hypothetical protein